MLDYDIPIMEHDLQELRKKAFTMRDMDGNEFIKFRDLLENCKHKKTAMTDLKELNKLVIRV